MARTVCVHPKKGRLFTTPHVAHGFTLEDPSTFTAELILRSDPTIKIPGTVKWQGQYWWVWFNIGAGQARKRYNLVLYKSGVEEIRVQKVKPTPFLLPTAAVTVIHPIEGSTATSHISLITYGTVGAGRFLQSAKLEYLDDEITFNGQILQASSPWVATFSCPGPTGPHEVTLTVKDDDTPANEIESTFTLTDNRILIGP